MTHDNAAPKNVTKRLRFEIFRRDGFRCRYCGLPAAETGEGLTIDHVIPKALGGTNEPGNLVTACKDCNSGKTSSGPDEAHVAQVADDALRWAAAVRQVHDDAQGDLHRFEKDVRAFARYWSEESDEPLPGGWKASVREFLAQGLSRADLLHYVDTASNVDRLRGEDARFRYFCGCCWNVITDRQKRAMELVNPTAEPTPAEPLQHGRVMLPDGIETYPLYTLGDRLRSLGVGSLDTAEIASELDLLVGDASQVVDAWHEWPSGWLSFDAEIEGELACFAGFYSHAFAVPD